MYIPLLTAHQMSSTGSGVQHKEKPPKDKISKDGEKKEKIKSKEDESLIKSSGKLILRDELLNRTHKFLGVVNSTLLRLQIEGLF